MNSNLKRLTELFENFWTNFPFCAAILLPRGESGCADWRTVAAATAGNWAETSSDEPNGVEISTLYLVWRVIASARFVAIFRTKFHGPKKCHSFFFHFFYFSLNFKKKLLIFFLFFEFFLWIFLNYFFKNLWFFWIFFVSFIRQIKIWKNRNV